MLDTIPTPTSVFTPEYWEETENYPSTPSVRMPKGMRSEVDELCGQAAANIFTDEPREAVIAGEALDYDPDNRYTQPGVILLTDVEVLMSQPSRSERRHYPGSESPIWKQRAMEDPMDLVAPAAALFKANSRMMATKKGATVPERPYVYPFERVLQDEGSAARYARIIGLTAFVYNRDGSTGGLPIRIWNSNNPDHPAGMPESMLDALSHRPHAPVKVGQSYKVPLNKKEKGFSSRYDICPDSDLTIRLRSAELCLQGVLQRSAEKKQAHRGLGHRLLSALPSGARPGSFAEN